jgi:hypothetical protein
MPQGGGEMTDRIKNSIDVALRFGERLGVPVLILAAFLWFSREAAVGLHKTVLEPVVKAHVEFLGSTQDTLRRIGDTQRQQTEAMQDIAEGQREITAILNSGTSEAKN